MKKFLASVLGAVVALGCAHAPKEKESDAMADRQPMYVDVVQAPETVPAGQRVPVQIEGNKPTPAWELADVTVDRKGDHVTITVWGRLKDKGPVIQMLEPFSKTVEVEGLTAGTWTIEVKGHGGSESVRVRVESPN